MGEGEPLQLSGKGREIIQKITKDTGLAPTPDKLKKLLINFIGDNQKAVWAKFSTLSQSVLLLNKVNEVHASRSRIFSLPFYK